MSVSKLLLYSPFILVAIAALLHQFSLWNEYVFLFGLVLLVVIAAVSLNFQEDTNK